MPYVVTLFRGNIICHEVRANLSKKGKKKKDEEARIAREQSEKYVGSAWGRRRLPGVDGTSRQGFEGMIGIEEELYCRFSERIIND